MRRTTATTGMALAGVLCLLLVVWGCAASEPTGPSTGKEAAKPADRPAERPAGGGPERPLLSDGERQAFDRVARPAGTGAGQTAGALRAGDLVALSVYNHPDLSVTVRIPREGHCTLPLLGLVDLAGLTLRALERKLKERYEDGFLTYAHVSAYVKEYAPRKAYILGAVVQPGAYRVDPAEGLTLLQILALARGFTAQADKERVLLIRTEGTKRASVTIPVLSMMEGRLGEVDVPLVPGDRVFVRTLEKIYVLGAVKSPRGVDVSSEEPLYLTRAVSLAGGFADEADRSQLLLMRHGGGGHSVQAVNFEAVARGRDPSLDVVLRPGDTVIVPTADKIFVLGSVTRPGGFRIPQGGLTATKAISLAGGFTKRANMDGTIVIRVVGGRKRTIPVQVSDVVSEGKGSEVDLRPGDIVYVPERFF